MRWIDVTDLQNWAPRNNCRNHLSLVIRRLIRSTAEDISKISFPTGDSTSRPGWDGILLTSKGNEFIPAGYSVWEIGTSQDIKAKANEDYQKRTQNPGSVDKADTTFVFITPRSWDKKNDWAVEKIKEKTWKNVMVYDGNTLEQWLEQAPAVGTWLARYLHKYPEGVQSLEDYWEEWISATKPELTKDVVLAGRKEPTKKVEEWLQTIDINSSQLTIQATSSEEAIAFFVSAIFNIDENRREHTFSRCIIANTIDKMRQIITTVQKPLIIVNNFQETNSIGFALKKGHSILFPTNPENMIKFDNKIVLPRLNRMEFVNALTKIDIAQKDAERLSKETGRSLSVLRRQLTVSSDFPQWAKSEYCRIFIPTLLLGMWDDSNVNDRDIVSKLAGIPYANYISSLSIWLKKSDTPILKIGSIWRLQSPIDAWYALSQYITTHDFDEFKKTILDVLKIPNPVLDLEPEKRWMAALYDKSPLFSNYLCEGITQVLILIAVFGDETNVNLQVIPQTWVDNIVFEILSNADGKKWASLDYVLPLLAEASPISFLRVLETTLSSKSQVIMELFIEEKNPMNSSSHHVWLLWALESLAWSPEFLGRVVRLLAQLIMIDPDGQSSNRPINSLSNIFQLMYPQTFASSEERFQALKLLVKESSKIAWDVLISIIPKHHSMIFPAQRTRWRQFSDKNDNKPTNIEFYNNIDRLFTLLMQNINKNGERWVQLLDNSNNFPQTKKEILFAKLQDHTNLKSGRINLWNKLRSMFHDSYTNPEAEWTLSENDVKKLKKVYNNLIPVDIYLKYGWLFDDYWPKIPEKIEVKNHEKHSETINFHRKKAIIEILKTCDFEDLIMFASKVKYPNYIGFALSTIDDVETKIIKSMPHLLNGDKNTIQLAQGYISGKISVSENWGKTISSKAIQDKWPAKSIINSLIALPFKKSTWTIANKFSKEISTGYWRKCRPWIKPLSHKDRIFALNKLISVNRFSMAIHEASFITDDLSPKLIIELLNGFLANNDTTESVPNVSHYLINLFEKLDKLGGFDKEIMQLEWGYMPLLKNGFSGRKPEKLHQAIANDPALFAELIKWIYKPQDSIKEQDEKISEELRQRRAKYASDLLSYWRIIPGSTREGNIENNILDKWVKKARALCNSIKRGKYADKHIGHVFAYALDVSGDSWPPESICMIIDSIKSKSLDSGFRTEIIRSRGVYSKSHLEGGEQEKDLAFKYTQYALKISNKYPRTGSILMDVADFYTNQAKREDEEADLLDIQE